MPGNNLPQVSGTYQHRMFMNTCIHAYRICDSRMETCCFATPSLPCMGDEKLFLLRDCRRDISSHLKTYGLSKCSEDICDEVDLLLCRGGFFDVTRAEGTNLKTCSYHRDRLGIYWRGRRRTCQVPTNLANHKGSKMKGDRSVLKRHSVLIKQLTETIVPVGSAICRECRKTLADRVQINESEPQRDYENASRTSKVACQKRLLEAAVTQTLTPKGADLSWRMDSPCSTESTEESAEETETSKSEHVDKLQAVNQLLTLDGHEPINRALQVSWVDATERTKRFYTSKMSEVVTTVLELIAPNDAGLLWRSLKESSQINERYSEPASSETSLLTALVESYKQATQHSTRRQILSVMADKLSFKDLEQLLPGLSRYRFHSARLHRLQHGVGAPLPQMPMAVRERVDPVRLEHFIDFITSQHIIQDLPFGRRKLKLSNGEALEIPNVVRLLIPSRLVNQYYQYCQETEFSCPLGKSTLFKILSESCSASIRRCMQGLDNYLADGARSFDELIDVVDKLLEVGLDGNTAVCLKESLKDGKQYLKGDYKVHVSSESAIPDHCRVFSLSDVENSAHQQPCNHEHMESCGRCLNLTQVLNEIQKQVEMRQFLCEDDKDEIIFLVQKAKQAISEWKAHQLRSVHQDVSRLDVLQSLNSTRVLIVQDFAMKFLPSRYREAQSDFFGKRGISWHITVCRRKADERLEAQTFIHILESGLQDSETVVLIMEHVLRSLKEQHPEITAAYFRQDNAGCYHSSCTILSARVLSTRSGVQVKQIDFSDPQGGKGSCDRKAAQVKAHIKSYVNEGNSVTTPSELKTAIESRGGIPGVRVAVVETSNDNRKTYKLEGINTLNNFSFSDQGFYAFRAYGIGPGKFFDWKIFEAVPEESDFSWLESVCFGDGDFSAVFQRDAQTKITADVSDAKQTCRLEKEENASNSSYSRFQSSDSSESSDQACTKIFSCPEEGCTKSFVRYSALERHCEYGVHIRSLEKVTLQDRAKLSYAQHLEEGQTKELPSVSLSDGPDSPLLGMGWALKVKPKTARFSEKQKSFLESEFLEGEKSSKKTTGEEVAKKMRKVRDANNQRLFSIDEFLTPSQISSYFSRFAAKRKQLSASEYQALENEDMLLEVRNDLMKSLDDECRGHPLVHGDLQLCQMTKEELTSLRMTRLKAICKDFDMLISGRRKEPYVNGVVSIVESCSCRARNVP